MDKDFGNIAFSVRCGKCVDPVFFQSWTKLVSRPNGIRLRDVVLEPTIDMPHHHAANIIAHSFLEYTECDTLLMIDDDMVFTVEDVDAFRDNPMNWPFDIVQALCVSRKEPHQPIYLFPSETIPNACVPFKPDPGDDTHVVAFVGMAFTLIRREVFEDLRADDPGDFFFNWGQDGTGEDVFFCRRAQAIGKVCAVDSTLPIGHQCTSATSYDVDTASVIERGYIDPLFVEMMQKQQELRMGVAERNGE